MWRLGFIRGLGFRVYEGFRALGFRVYEGFKV